MTPKTVRRLLLLAMFVGGPVAGWFINGHRGLMFGAAVSALAVGWFLLEARRLV